MEPETAKSKNKNEFEFCKVCRLNHNQGRRHNYFPNHIKSLNSFLSRVHSKISELRFFLRNPTPLRPEHASRNRFWCVFCDADVSEVGSSFACHNAISHLACADHLKNFKSFMWKYGGKMDRVDQFRVLEAELAKYEKKCLSLKDEVAGRQSHGALIGPLNDIHNELNFESVDNFGKNNINSCNPSFSNGVLPLQIHTNEKYQVPNSEVSSFTAIGTSLPNANTGVARTQLDSYTQCSNNLTGYMDNQNSSGRKYTGGDYNGIFPQVYPDEMGAKAEGSSAGLLKLTQISPKIRDKLAGNVHSGAPPPWFDADTTIQVDGSQDLQVGKNSIGSPIVKNGKSSKLNPKRVGAAWAERRKIEMEMEKRGELPTNKFDASWLPNFGRVWQSGSRKESRKEFEVEAKKPVEDEVQSGAPMQLQPYISKRMRRDVNG